MKTHIFSNKKIWLYYIILSLLLYAFFSAIDLFDLMYTYSRAHENWELDELFGILPVIAIIASLIAIANQRKLKLLNDSLEQQVKEKSEKLIEQERMLYHQARLSAIGETLSMIAHQWRQPLNSPAFNIITLNSLIKEEAEIDIEKIDAIHEDMENTLQNLSKTINDFHTFYGFLGGSHHPARICQIIEDALKIFQPILDSHTIKTENCVTCTDNTYLKSSEYKMEQIFSILIANSIDAIGRAIKANRLQEGEGSIRFGFALSGDRCKISLEDNGGGIPEEILPKVCDPYFTTKHSSYGTGLSLYMVKMTIERHLEGTFSIENGKHGAIVTIELPIEENPKTAKIQKQ